MPTTENPPVSPGDQLVPGDKDAPAPKKQGETAADVAALVTKQIG